MATEGAINIVMEHLEGAIEVYMWVVNIQFWRCIIRLLSELVFGLGGVVLVQRILKWGLEESNIREEWVARIWNILHNVAKEMCKSRLRFRNNGRAISHFQSLSLVRFRTRSSSKMLYYLK